MPPKKRSIEDEIDHILTELKSMSVDSDKYAKAINNLEGLCKARATTLARFVTPDTIVLCITNLVGILLILNYEKLNVVSSKTLGLILKGRI